MKIFEELLAGLGVAIVFDEDGVFSCQLHDEQKHGADPYTMLAFRDDQEMRLHIFFVVREALPKSLPLHFFYEFGRQALGPCRQEIGVGVLPETESIVVFRTINISDAPKIDILDFIQPLLMAVEYWEEKTENLKSAAPQESLSREWGRLRA